MPLDLTIIAYADQPGYRVERLLWSLARRRPADSFLVLVADLTGSGDPELLRQAKLYRSAFPLTVVRDGGEAELGSIAGGSVIVLPASAIPVGEAVKTLYETGTCLARCRQPGPLCAVGMNEMGDNLTPDVVEDCPWTRGRNAWSFTANDWRRPNDAHCWSLAEADFVLYPPPESHDCFYLPEMLVTPCTF